MIEFISGMIGTFLLWTFYIYWVHRIAHIKHRYNIFYTIHAAHHRIPYFAKERVLKPSVGQYFFWLGEWKTSLDIIIVMTFPLLVITYFWPQYGVWWLIFHYLYEVFCSEDLLDHNTRLNGPLTRIFAWGNTHLYHHVYVKKNYALITNFWDYVFGTFVFPPEDFTEQIVERRRSRAALARVSVPGN